ncbi:hypothetical protein ACB098_02G140900 [Castanea mollissima]
MNTLLHVLLSPLILANFNSFNINIHIYYFIYYTLYDSVKDRLMVETPAKHNKFNTTPSSQKNHGTME